MGGVRTFFFNEPGFSVYMHGEEGESKYGSSFKSITHNMINIWNENASASHLMQNNVS